MSESKPLQILRLQEQCERAMLADAALFRPALDRAAREHWPPDRLAALARDIESSTAWRARRERERPVPRFTADLPVIARREEIARAVRSHQVCIVCGETGSGKTTQLPQICLSLGRGIAGMIGHTQPRRLAARSVSARIADELSTPLGEAVGFKIRFGDRTSDRTFIKVMTDGILLAETQGDRDLWMYDTIIIDEAHERSLNIDFLLGYIRQLLPRRPDLKVIVTSATIDPQRLSEHFGGPAVAPVIEVSGRTYPVEVRYRPGEDGEDFEEGLERAVVDAVEEVCSPRNPPGDVLVFLPGEREIRSCLRSLRAQTRHDLDILPLYSRLTNAEQDRIFRSGSQRRVILATNVAETSLTVPGIRYVVDTGLARHSKYDPKTRVQRLPIATISQASAQQRAGRCGRIGPGVCIRLYSNEQFATWPQFTTPEVLRTNLASVILQMKSLALGPIEEFPFVEAPPAPLVRDGYQTLHELSAIDQPDASGALTPIGRRLARLPIDPRIARMVIAAEDEGCVREVLILAAALSVQDPRDRPMSRQRDADTAHLVFWNEHSDFIVLLNIWDQYQAASENLSHGPLMQWCRDRFVNFNRLREWAELERQLRGLVLGGEDEDATDAPEEPERPGTLVAPTKPLPDRIHRALMTGLLSNLCCRDEGGPFEYQGSRGNRVAIFPGSVLFKKGPKWLMAAELVQTTKLFARTCAKVEAAWIEELATHVMAKVRTDPHFDRELGAAAIWERLTLAGAVVVPRRKVALAPLDPVAARELFIRHALAGGEYKGAAPFHVHNLAMLQAATGIEARLRKRGVLRSTEEVAAWFQARVGSEVSDPATFENWRAEAEKRDPGVLKLASSDLVKPEYAAVADTDAFPDELKLGDAAAQVEYAFEPGKEEDGVTAIVNLLELAAADDSAAQWLVPGLLADKVLALLKALPKSLRTPLEGQSGLAELARECAGVMAFGAGPLGSALSEAVEVLRSTRIPPEAWQESAVPDYLRLRLVVRDDHGKELAEGRDIADITARLAGRLRKAQAGAARAGFEKTGLHAWTFGDLPESVPTSRGDETVTAYPALLDQGESVALTLVDVATDAAALTDLGVRRLFVLAAADELDHRIESLPSWEELKRQHKPLGSEAELLDALRGLIADRVFMLGQSRIRTAEAFEARKLEQWGRLGQATLEVGGAISRILEARSRIAGRLAGGTPRQWATSVADMREHAAYLMPRGFLKALPWERLREYPRYTEALRARLLKLREDGKDVESGSLALVLPHWKKFTGWVASGMSRERAAAAESGERTTHGGAKPGPTKQPLPGAKRAAPTVNVDAGEWAMRPGTLPPSVSAFRWAVEEYRAAVFAPEMGGGPSVKKLEELWSRV